MVYYGFISNYNHIMMSRESFVGLYDTGVFYYRILSKYLLLGWDDFIDPSHREFYRSTFYFNTFFLILSGIVTVGLVNLNRSLTMSRSERYFILFLVPLVVNITQYVVVPYDVLSYFFQLLIIWIFLKYYLNHFVRATMAICLLLILSTLNRESSALSISFIAAVIFFHFGFKKKDIISLSLFALSFLGTYLALRALIPKAPPDPQLAPYLVGNLALGINRSGLLFWILLGSFTYMLSNNDRNRNVILFFYLAGAPYVFTVWKNGILWEVRLFIPLFLGSLLLSKLGSPPNVENAAASSRD